MKNSTRIFSLLVFAFIIYSGQIVRGQSILNPADPVVTYNPAAPPTQPAFGTIGKWVRTVRMSWNTNGYKAYIYKNNQFRLYFPKTYNPTAVDGKKYPMLVFYHGVGEAGTIYDNEYSLYHGGQFFAQSVDNGTFDGYILVMQTGGGWGPVQYGPIKEIIDYMVTNNKLDPFHVGGNGLSGGGGGTWNFYLTYPTYNSCIIPMSAVDIAYTADATTNLAKYTPIWNIHGGLDGNPAPYTCQQVNAAFQAKGANYLDKNYTTLGHDTWDSTWQEPNFWPFLNAGYAANPWTLFGRTQFCTGDPINLTVGLQPGFAAYQWRMNGTVIPGAASNTINVTSIGTYDARIQRGGIWSDWSHIPVVISIKQPTVTPPIRISGLLSDAIPSADGNTFVNLEVPDSGYTSYTWEKVGSSTVLGTQRIFKVTQPGKYIVSVTQQFGCSSNFSPAFTVINAGGSNPPSPATNLTASPLSFTQVDLNWARNPSPVNPEVAFEIYRSVSTGGPYSYIGQAPADSVHYTDNNLTPNTKYYYVVRAIDSTAAAALSNQAAAVTQSDKIPPSAPGNLRLNSTTQTSISIAWDPATDNVGVSRYFVYVNGLKSYVTTQTNFLINGLTANKQYSVYVVAQDISGNISTPSNQVSAASVNNGFSYKYYATQTGWNVLPNFATLSPTSTGTMPNISISNATQTINFGYLWQGYINITVAGTYTFATTSDDGSALWWNTTTPTGTPLVNNDGLHGSQTATGTVTLQPGVYPLCIGYFQNGGGANMAISWACTALFGDNNQHPIADSYFANSFNPGGTAPAIPTVVKATANAYNKVTVNWTDNSNNEKGFEIYRSVSAGGPFAIVATTGANLTGFTDSIVQPSTTYYYKVQAINQYGSSGFDPASSGGIAYSYYQFGGNWNNMPNFNTLTPVTTGYLTNISLSPATSTTNFAFKFQGTINIPTTGSYTFFTTSDDGSDLYVGGFDSAHLVVQNDFLQAPTQRSGTVTLNQGSYPFYVTYFQQGGGYALSAAYAGPGISQQNIPDSAFQNNQSAATTFALPAKPSSPYNFTVTANSSSGIVLGWQDSSALVTGFQVYRSIGDSTHPLLLTSLPGTATAYTDTALFSNQLYYYKVSAVGAGGNSSYSPTLSTRTKDSLPVIIKLAAQSVRYGTVSTVPVSAASVNSGTLTFSAFNLPPFGSFTDNGNRTGSLTFSPAVTDQGLYPNLYVVVTDAFGGTDTTKFSLSVNNNYAPTVDTIVNYTINEGDTLTIPLSAHDQNVSDTLTFSVSNLPNAFTLTPQSNGVASLFLHPGYAAAGVYTVQVVTKDNNGLSTTRPFILTIKNKDPNTKIFSRFAYQDAGVLPTQWNALLGATTTNLKDSSGNPTTVGLVFSPTTWWNTFNGGSSTGNNSGMYPDAVLQDYYWFGSVYGGPNVINGSVTGVDTSQLYNLTFFANSVYNGLGDNGTSTYTANGQTVSLYVQNNKTNTVSINNIKPAANGTIAFSMGKTTSTQLGYINALVITKQFDDGSVPAPASLLTGQKAPGKISLSWTDAAYNATGYEVWRAPATTGVYRLLGTATGNTANSYVDSNITGNTQYYYTVRSYNGHGFSTYSDTVNITTANRLPKITAIANVSLKNNQQQTINVTTVDDPTAQLTLTAANLPPFATFVDNGNGTGMINIVPTAGTVGVYPNVTVTVADQLDSTASTSFILAVTEPNVQSVYVNFTGGPSSPQPWNTLKAPPFAGTVMSGLLDDGNNVTTTSVTLPDGFNWFSATGWNPGSNDGVYPPSVMKNGVYEPTTATRRIQVKGLSTTKLYNFVFFNSQQDGTQGLTNFTINGKTVSLNAMFNINKTVQINGIAPDATGLVTIGVAKGTGAANAYLSSVVIQGYAPTLLLNPADLRALTRTQTTVKLQWQDRSASETGFEVWRASDSNATYTRIVTLAANTTTYTDTHLSPNSTYYYIVRAVNGGVYSAYSSVLPVTTYSDAVYVNVTTVSDGPAPWNNLNQPSAIGLVWNNFLDSTGNATSINMTQTQDFAGANSLGYVTGNNSGVYPDAVIKEDYVAFQGQVGAFQLSGLNLSKTYDLTFFGSENLFGDNTGAYVVNGDTVFLNAMYNSNATVTMHGLQPDINGILNVKIMPYGVNSGGGWINAMVIQGFNVSGYTAPTPPVSTGGANSLVVTGGQAATLAGTSAQANLKLNAYPNPFHQFFTLLVPAAANDEKVQVTVYDMGGRLAYMKEFSGLVQGDNYLRVDTDQNFSQPGVYIIEVVYADRKTVKTFKLLKQ
jgi:fibronectin type 3 domain-containing protein/predicted esterase